MSEHSHYLESYTVEVRKYIHPILQTYLERVYRYYLFWWRVHF